MIPIIKKFFHDLLFDELAVRRWARASIFALGTGGLAYGNQLAEAIKLPGLITSIKVASISCFLIAGAITAGEKNKPEVSFDEWVELRNPAITAGEKNKPEVPIATP